MVRIIDDVLVAAKKECRRQRHNDANARYRANLSPEKKAASLERDRETHRRRRAAMTDRQREELRANAREYQARKRSRRADDSNNPAEAAILPTASPVTRHWWQDEDEVDLEKVWKEPQPKHNKRKVYQCSNCEKIFWNSHDVKLHEFGIIGNLGSQENKELFWVNLPCGAKSKPKSKSFRTVNKMEPYERLIEKDMKELIRLYDEGKLQRGSSDHVHAKRSKRQLQFYERYIWETGKKETFIGRKEKRMKMLREVF